MLRALSQRFFLRVLETVWPRKFRFPERFRNRKINPALHRRPVAERQWSSAARLRDEDQDGIQDGVRDGLQDAEGRRGRKSGIINE